MRGDRRSFRRAVTASVALHAALAVVLLLVGRWAANQPQPTRPPGIDTRVDEAPRIAVRFAEEPAVEVAVKPEPRPSGTPPPSTPEPAPNPAPPTGSRPEVVRIPATLPSELLALMRKPSPVGPAVVEVPLTPTRMNTPPAPSPSPPRVQQAAHTSVPPVHGALGAGQTIVYVLDASGSMGEWGKFAKARAALIATLRAQPPTVRFQVVLYAGTADTLLQAPIGGCAAATADNIDRIEEKLGIVAPAGRSDHAAGLRAALALRPDFVLILTDAADLPTAKLRGVLTQHGRPVKVCVAKVGAEGIAKPVELK